MHHHYFIYDVFDCTADLVGQLNGNGQKGMLQIDAPLVENFWLCHCPEHLPHEQYHPEHLCPGLVTSTPSCP